jgi:molybdopterin/thiamine biosynthesis adenylyltransferase
VWLVRLAAVSSPDEVVPMIAAVLDAARDLDRTPEAAIAMRLEGRGRTLLILDNLEHLLTAVPAIARLLEVVPGLFVLATSQAPLRLAAERCLPIDALDDDAAISLIERAARQRAAPLEGGRDQQPR